MNILASTVIDLLNGNKAAAEFFGVTPGAVSQWRKILAEHPDPDLEETVRENLERAESDSL